MAEAREARALAPRLAIRLASLAVVLLGVASAARAGEPASTSPRLAARDSDPVTRALETPLESPYEEAVSDLFGHLQAARGLLTVCAELYPQHRESNEAGYERWRMQQGAAIADIESHGRVLILRQSGGVQVVASEVEARLYQQMGDGYARNYEAATPAEFAVACATYPAVIAQSFDFGTRRAAELELIRANPLQDRRQ